MQERHSVRHWAKSRTVCNHRLGNQLEETRTHFVEQILSVLQTSLDEYSQTACASGLSKLAEPYSTSGIKLLPGYFCSATT